MALRCWHPAQWPIVLRSTAARVCIAVTRVAVVLDRHLTQQHNALISFISQAHRVQRAVSCCCQGHAHGVYAYWKFCFPGIAHTCHSPRTVPVLSLLQRCCRESSPGRPPHCLECSQLWLGPLDCSQGPYHHCLGSHSYLGSHSCWQLLHCQHLLLLLAANSGCCCCCCLQMQGLGWHAAAAAQG